MSKYGYDFEETDFEEMYGEEEEDGEEEIHFGLQ